MLTPIRTGLLAYLLVLPLTAQLLQEDTDLKVPLTAAGKAGRTLRLTFNPTSTFGSLAGAEIDQLDHYPEEWGQGAKGYGHRFISLYGRFASTTAIKLGVDVALKTDPRYDRCDCTGFLPRSTHAVKRLFVTRKDAGGEMVNVAALVGIYGAAAIADQWMPDRLNTAGHHFETGTVDLGFAAATNLAREFWPEIRKKLPFRK